MSIPISIVKMTHSELCEYVVELETVQESLLQSLRAIYADVLEQWEIGDLTAQKAFEKMSISPQIFTLLTDFELDEEMNIDDNP